MPDIIYTLYTHTYTHTRTHVSKDAEKREWLETPGSAVRCWLFFLPCVLQTWREKSWQVRNNNRRRQKTKAPTKDCSLQPRTRKGPASEDRKSQTITALLQPNTTEKKLRFNPHPHQHQPSEEPRLPLPQCCNESAQHSG